MINRKAQRSGILKASLILLVASLIFTACKRATDLVDQPPNQDLTSSTSPPFSTKEPHKYQATRIISFTDSSAAGATGQTRSSKVLLARDGERRREEYEAGSWGTIVFLENESGRFILLPQAKLYADVNDHSTAMPEDQLQIQSELTSPDLLLHQSDLAVQYHKLGSEVIAGRTATKYRLVNPSASNTESFIWIDERLDMPIATQSSGPSTRVSMELQDIRTEVDPAIFALPLDYRKVAATQIWSMVRAGRSETDSK